MFDRPAPPGDRFVNEQNVGNLLVIEVLEPVYGVQTENGVADCIRANVHVIQPPGSIGASYMGTLLFGKVLFSRLVQSVGRTVLGVLTGQPGVKVAGKNVAYDLDDPTDAMEAAAVRAMTSRAQPAQQQPAQPAWGGQPPAAPPWGQPPAAPGWGQQQPAAAPQPGWGQPPAAGPQQGPPPGWGQQPSQAPQSNGAPWGFQPAAQQQLPVEPPELPPWEQQQPTGQGWGQ